MNLRRRLRRTGSLILVGAALVTAVVVGNGAKAQADVPFGIYTLAGLGGRCLSFGTFNGDDNVPDGAPLWLENCITEPGEDIPTWDIVQGQVIAETRTEANSLPPNEKCLDIDHTSHVAVGLWRCDFTSATQHWAVVGTNPGEIRNQATGQCLQADSNSVVVAACTNATDQLWSPWAESRLLTVPPDQTGTVGTAIAPVTLAVDDLGHQFSSYTWSADGLPPGLTIACRVGDPPGCFNVTSISGTPTAAGSYLITYTATDTKGTQFTFYFRFTVNPAPVPVPDVVGLTQTAAITSLHNAGLVQGNITPVFDCDHIHIVLSQSPGQPAVRPPGSGVDLWVGSSRDPNDRNHTCP